MTRAPFQVLVLPYRLAPVVEDTSYAILRRTLQTGGYWQGIAGGGEGEETPLDAARREANEEAGISTSSRFVLLDTVCSVSVEAVSGFRWGPHVPVIREYSFGVRLEPADADLVLSNEHTEHMWLPYEEAVARLRWDSNRIALWELHYRIRSNLLGYDALPTDW